MGRLERFEAKSEKVDLDGIELEITALKAKDGSILVRAQSNPNDFDAVIELVCASLQSKQPDITKQELESLDIKIFGKLVEAVFKVNGIDVEVKKSEEMTG